MSAMLQLLTCHCSSLNLWQHGSAVLRLVYIEIQLQTATWAWILVSARSRTVETMKAMQCNAKCNAQLLSTKQKHLRSSPDEQFTLNHHSNALPTVVSTKFLGVQFDKFMTWDNHINHVHKQTNRNLYLLKQIRNYLALDARKLFYNSCILPYFDYCCAVWGNCSKTLLDELPKLQRCAVYLILDVQNITIPSYNMFSDLEWMPLPDRSTCHQSFQVLKCLKGQCSSDLETSSRPCSQIWGLCHVITVQCKSSLTTLSFGQNFRSTVFSQLA